MRRAKKSSIGEDIDRWTWCIDLRWTDEPSGSGDDYTIGRVSDKTFIDTAYGDSW